MVYNYTNKSYQFFKNDKKIDKIFFYKYISYIMKKQILMNEYLNYVNEKKKDNENNKKNYFK